MEPREEPRKSSTVELIDYFWKPELTASVSRQLEQQILLHGKKTTPGFEDSVRRMLRSTSREAADYHRKKSPNDSLTRQFHLAQLNKRMRGYLVNVRKIPASKVPESFDLLHEAAPAGPAPVEPTAAAAAEPAFAAKAPEPAVRERVGHHLKALTALRTALSESRKGLVAAYRRGVTPANRFVWKRRKIIIPAALGAAGVAALAYQAIAGGTAGEARTREPPKAGDVSKIPGRSALPERLAEAETRRGLREPQKKISLESLATTVKLSDNERVDLQVRPNEDLHRAIESYNQGDLETAEALARRVATLGEGRIRVMGWGRIVVKGEVCNIPPSPVELTPTSERVTFKTPKDGPYKGAKVTVDGDYYLSPTDEKIPIREDRPHAAEVAQEIFKAIDAKRRAEGKR